MNQLKHIIDKVVVEVNTTDEQEAYRIKDNIGSFLREQVFPEIEKLFDEYKTEDIVRMERLSIELNASFDEPDAMKEAIMGRISKALVPVRKRDFLSADGGILEQIEIVSSEKRGNELFLFFIENGYLPWYASPQDVRAFVADASWEKHLHNVSFREQLTALLAENRLARERFVLQIDSHSIMIFLRKISAVVDKLRGDIDKTINDLPKVHQKIFLRLLLHQVLFGSTMEENGFSDELYREFERYDVLDDSNFYKKTSPVLKILFKETPLSGRLRKVVTGADLEITMGVAAVESEDGLKTPHAGLILLHPFLPHFFRTIGLLDEEKSIKSDKLEMAVQCLAYMVTGQSDFFEGDMLLEKFLCDMPLGMPVSKDDLTTDEMKSEIEVMLQEVVKHWPALKNTSVDGLRAMFLQRDGKLVNDDGRQRLIVERKVQDVLLGNLDWNIGMIRLPWKKEFLFVDW